MPKLVDKWTSANAYDLFMGRWSRLIAYEFLDWLGVARNRRWLEMGCGTGALTKVILERCDPAEILALDPSKELLALARDNVPDMRVQFAKGHATDFPTPGHPIDVYTSGLVLNFVPKPEAAIRFAIEQMAPGGLISAYVWDYSDGMEFLRVFWDAAIEIDPAAVDLDEGRGFHSAGQRRSKWFLGVQASKALSRAPFLLKPASPVLRTIGTHSSAVRAPRRHLSNRLPPMNAAGSKMP